MCITCFVTQLICFSYWGLLIYFTNWTLEITTLSIAMSILCSRDPEIETKRWKLAITHILFEAALFMNIIVIVFYWGLIHAHEIGNFKELGLIHMYIVHSFPTIAFLINFLNTDIVVYDGHMKGLAFIGLVYSVTNAYNTITTG